MPVLSPLYDIKSLIERYASIDIVGRPATVKGVLEYHSNCPWCGGTDRFVTRPETGQYSCAIRSSGCERSGDCLDFLKDYCNMSHSEACEVLQLENNADYVPSTPSQHVQSGKEHAPLQGWQTMGKDLVERAQKCLWSPAGKDMLDYLHSRRLGDDILKKKKWGYVPLQKDGKYFESELEDWGLDPETSAKDKVRIPNGILIPWFEGSTLWRLAIKRPGEKQSYGQVIGSGEGLYNVDTVQYDFPAMIVEGEICALSVEQECGDLVSCVATGSTTRGRLARWAVELRMASYVLQSFDEDDSGDEGSEYWMQNLKRCMRWSPYVAKDPNDILRGKYVCDTRMDYLDTIRDCPNYILREEYDSWACTLRQWVEAGILSAKVEFGLNPLLPIEPDTPIPLARGELPVRKQDFPVDLSRTKFHGPEADLNALTIKEQLHNSFTPMAFINSKCPCGCGRFR